MAFDALQIQDRMAEERLVNLLGQAIAALEPLNAGYGAVLVAECPDKFNDAFWDDLWFGVQVGTAYWEQAQYFRDVSPPVVEETTKVGPRSKLPEARAVLERLHAAGWRDEVGHCLGEDIVRSGDVVGLGLQFGQPWLCVASSNNDTEIACTVSAEHGIVHMARCERFDQSFGDFVPLPFSDPRPDFAHYLTEKGRTHFFPAVQWEQPARQLCGLLNEAVARIENIPGTSRKRLELLAAVPFVVPHLARPPIIRWGDEWVPATKPTSLPFEALAGVVAGLEIADWRHLFGLSMRLGTLSGSFGLLCLPGQPPLLAWELTVFDFQSGTLRPVGLFNGLRSADPEVTIQPIS